VGVAVGVEGAANTSTIGEGVGVAGMIGTGVSTIPGVTTTTGVWTAATGDGVPRIGAREGGLAGGAAFVGGPTATATGPDVGDAVGCARGVALDRRRGGDACLREGRAAASRTGVGRVDTVGTPAATEAWGLKETGVAV
jgi:hypothetical protein